MWVLFLSIALVATVIGHFLFQAYLNSLLNGQIAFGYRGWITGVAGCACLFSIAAISSTKLLYENTPVWIALFFWPVFMLALDAGYRALRVTIHEKNYGE